MAEDLYKVFGMDSAAGRAMFQLYKKKIPLTVPQPKQKSQDQLIAEAAAGTRFATLIHFIFGNRRFLRFSRRLRLPVIVFKKFNGGVGPAKPKPKPKVVVKFLPKVPDVEPRGPYIPRRKPLEVIRRETDDYAPEAYRPAPARTDLDRIVFFC
jgi:hypothetical protein